MRSLLAALLHVMHVTILLHETLRKCKAALLVACVRLLLLVTHTQEMGPLISRQNAASKLPILDMLSCP